MQGSPQSPPQIRALRVAAIAVVAALFLFASTAKSYNISLIDVSPDDPIEAGSPVTLDIDLWTPTSSIYLFDDTLIEINATTIAITISSATRCEVSSPVPICDRAVGNLRETVLLGPLAPGNYTVDVATDRLYYFGFQPDWDTAQATFTVVPEPSTALLIGLGLAWVSGAARRAAPSYTKIVPSA